MSFDNLPPQGPINPKADAYSVECLRLSRQAASTARAIIDVRYGDHPDQALDVYLPAERTADGAPVLVFMHGGGWTHGYKEWCGFMAPPLVDLPAIVVSVSYRLLPAVSYPTPAEDCVQALAWVHANIGRHGGAPDRIFVGGHSAGGQIAALMALNDDWMRDAGLPPDTIKGVFCFSTTFNRRMVNPNAAPDHVPKEPFTEIAPGSPLALADRARTPFFIAWGGNEDERLERTGRQMIDALTRARCPVETHVAPYRDHFEVHLDMRDPGNWWTRRVRAWMAAKTLPPA